MSIKSDVKESVLLYLKQQNRPYSANDITLNLHKEFGKTAIQKALDELSVGNLIKEKVYGKQKVYAPLQDENIDKINLDTILSDLDREIANASNELSAAEQKLKAFESEVKLLTNQTNTEDALNEEKVLRAQVDQMKSKLSELSSNNIVVSSSEKDKISKLLEKVTSDYRKRKRICLDIASAILENYPKSKKAFYEEVGLETDEDVGFS